MKKLLLITTILLSSPQSLFAKEFICASSPRTYASELLSLSLSGLYGGGKESCLNQENFIFVSSKKDVATEKVNRHLVTIDPNHTKILGLRRLDPRRNTFRLEFEVKEILEGKNLLKAYRDHLDFMITNDKKFGCVERISIPEKIYLYKNCTK